MFQNPLTSCERHLLVFPQNLHFISEEVFILFSLFSSFDSNQVHLAGTSGQNQPGQQGQHIYTEYQNLGPNNGLHGPFSGPKEGQRPTLREPLVYVPVPGPDGHRVPLVKVVQLHPRVFMILRCGADFVLLFCRPSR